MDLSSESFWELFESLPTPTGTEESVYSASEESGGYRIARNIHDQPCLLIKSEYEAGLVPPRLRHLRILPAASCDIMPRRGGRERHRLTVIEPVDVERRLGRFLVGVYHTLALEAGPCPTTSELQVLLGGVAELFRRLESRPRTTAQGLWAELFVILHASNPVLAARAWHEDFGERWDFADGELRLEVKSSGAAGDRRHQFTLDQLCSPEDIDVWVLSLWAVRGANAVSISGLLEALREHLKNSPETLSRVERIAASAIGEAATDMLDEAFDPTVAGASATFVPAAAVPRPACDQPAGVSRLRFVSDLEFTECLRPNALSDRNDLLGDVAKGLATSSGGGNRDLVSQVTAPVPQFADRPSSSPAASRSMRGNVKRDTKPELMLRKALWARGARYRLHASDLPGRPDIVFRRKKVAIFCDGDFWHGRDWDARRERLETGSNSDYWIPKIRANMVRDRAQTAELERQGWTVLRYWEGEIKEECDAIAGEILSVLDDDSS